MVLYNVKGKLAGGKSGYLFLLSQTRLGLIFSHSPFYQKNSIHYSLNGLYKHTRSGHILFSTSPCNGTEHTHIPYSIGSRAKEFGADEIVGHRVNLLPLGQRSQFKEFAETYFLEPI